jgi:hypothetical protein
VLFNREIDHDTDWRKGGEESSAADNLYQQLGDKLK